MPEINVKGIHKVKKRLTSGRIVEYHRVGRGVGAQTFWNSDTEIALGSAEYLEALNMVTREALPSNNLFRGLISQYLISKDFKKLSARYQKNIQYSISATNGVDERFGDAPVAAFNNPKIRGIALE